MKPKHFFTIICIALFSTIVTPSFALDPVDPVKTETTDRAQEITNRVMEIRAMDKSTLSAKDKKELRKELKSLKKEAAKGQGIYLSIGAIVIIVLLLLLLL